MRCPICQAPLQETSSCCAQCHYDLERAARQFGIPPQLQVPLTDLAGVLSPRQVRAAQRCLAAFTRRFPQMFLHVVMAKLAVEQSLAATAFFYFNQGGLCAPLEKGGSCRDVLLLLDVEQRRAACIIGYGLEPFVSQEALNEIARATLPAMLQSRGLDAIRHAVEKAEEVFASAARSIPHDYGLLEPEIQEHVPAADQSFAY